MAPRPLSMRELHRLARERLGAQAGSLKTREELVAALGLDGTAPSVPAVTSPAPATEKQPEPAAVASSAPPASSTRHVSGPRTSAPRKRGASAVGPRPAPVEPPPHAPPPPVTTAALAAAVPAPVERAQPASLPAADGPLVTQDFFVDAPGR